MSGACVGGLQFQTVERHQCASPQVARDTQMEEAVSRSSLTKPSVRPGSFPSGTAFFPNPTPERSPYPTCVNPVTFCPDRELVRTRWAKCNSLKICRKQLTTFCGWRAELAQPVVLAARCWRDLLALKWMPRDCAWMRFYAGNPAENCWKGGWPHVSRISGTATVVAVDLDAQREFCEIPRQFSGGFASAPCALEELP